MVRVCKSSNIFLCVRPYVRPSSVHLSVMVSPSKPLAGIQPNWAEFKPYITSPHGKGVREQHFFPCVRRPSICPSRYLFLNHWVESNQTCYITSSNGKGVREQYYFSGRPSSVHLSVMLSPPKPLVGIQPNLVHHFPSLNWYARATLIFRLSTWRLSICLSRYLLLNYWAEFTKLVT